MTNANYGIQNIPVSDSPNNDAFEAIVEAYFQTQGYITSVGKWFWVFEEGKKQRGYQDIDVLAINGNETVIVSVTSNLDDKVNTKKGIVDEDMLKKLQKHFNRVCRYLKTVGQYQWMVNDRNVRYVVAYSHAYNKTLEPICEKLQLQDERIDVLSAETMLDSLRKYASKPNLKIQNQLLRTIQLLMVHVSQ